MISSFIDYPLQNIMDVHNFMFEDLMFIFLVVVTCYTTGLLVFNTDYNMLQTRLHALYSSSHNTLLETIWTIIPCLFILLFMYPSMALLYLDENVEKASILTVNIMGNQWYWVYEVNTSLATKSFTSNLVVLENLSMEHPSSVRLLTTNESLIVPVGIKNSLYITSNDVAHSWAMPALGVKVDAMPGRMNLYDITPTMLGMYSGMCSELCGVEHGFMPMSLHVVSTEDWLQNLKTKNYGSPDFLNTVISAYCCSN